jgi:hypothetical protein
MSSFIARLHIPVNPIIIIITFSHVWAKKEKEITDHHISLLFFILLWKLNDWFDD